MKKLILIFILLIGLLLRVTNLNSRPLGFTWDEAALGYNAYSLLNTGRDEFGQVAPLVFKSFGDYKPGLYIYLAVPTIKLFGLTEFATRFPSAIFGTLLILLIYLLAYHLFNAKTALFSALTVSIMPWAVHFSRGSWESNVSLVLTTLGALLFIRKKYIQSFVFMSLTLWTYQGAKMFTPLILLCLIVFYSSRQHLKQLLLPILLLGLLSLPILMGLGTQSGRLKVFSVFSYTRQEDTVNRILSQDNTPKPDPVFYLFHSEPLDQIRGVVQRYLNHFSPRYLFFEGDWSNPRQATPYSGYLYIPELLTLLIGLVVLIRSNSKASLFILLWLVLAPIPSALSRDIVSAVRSLPMLVPLTIISGIGLTSLSNKKLIFVPFVLILMFFCFYFLDLYFIHSQHFTAEGWLYPYKPSFQVISQNIEKYDHIVFSPKLGQPYIFALFYLRVDPKKFQAEHNFKDNSVGDVGFVPEFDKFNFRPIYWPNDRGLSSTLFVGDQYELPESDIQSTPNAITISDINYPNGSPGLRIVGLP